MSVTVTQYPRRTVGSNISRWVAAHNPVIYQMARQDFAVNNVQLNVTFSSTQPSVNVNVTTAQELATFNSIAVGDRIYINAGAYVGLYEVVLTDITGTFYHIVIDTPYTSAAWSGYVNAVDSLANYWLETQVVKWNGSAWEDFGATFRNYPNAAGLLKLDIQSAVQNMPGFWNDFDYATLNLKDEKAGGRFNIKWRENWDGSANSFTTVVPANRHFYVNAARQILMAQGQNMYEHVPFEPADAKFLSGFERPVYFPGYPFDLSFIYSDIIASHPVYRMERLKQRDGSTNSPVATLLDPVQAVNVNRMLTSEDFGDAKSVDVWLESDPAGGGIPALPYVTTGVIVTGYVSGNPPFNPYE